MNPRQPFWIPPDDADIEFPDASQALSEPDGLLAVGGDLSPERLLNAYRNGIFPWYSDGQPILWWSPDPRTVLYPPQVKVSRSLRKLLRQERFELSYDRAFERVIRACATPRKDGAGTWITESMIEAYATLHRLGHAHSVECWQAGELVGGLYGVSIGRAFFGESMFSRERDASKVAFVKLAQQLVDWRFGLVDCQVYSLHLASLGAITIPRAQFLQHLDTLCSENPVASAWQCID
ncbi:Leucyl/phenylalanyl-tRNA--protein transferase [hydrothermal vent metagenome]|uniref:Leucyl/phenylalanyl-tRNA--protein transferase n=1 Tax=hydrothermal vent metagenome TaxID=652676 RepID=A0A3B0ZJW4_9ZZZZ